MRRAAWIVCASLAACSVPEYKYPPGAPRITRFELTPIEAVRGTPVIAAWSVEDAERVTLGPSGEAAHEVAPIGSEELILDRPLMMELIAENEAGTTRSVAAARLFDPQPVQIIRFDVAPPRALPGDPIQLSWETINAGRVVLRFANGVPIDDRAPASGQHVLRAEDDFGVELFAEGFMGPAIETRAVLVRDVAPRIVRFRAYPEIVSHGEPAVLDWNVFAAQLIQLYELYPDGSTITLFEGLPAPGDQSVPIDTTRGSRTFRLIATNEGATISESTRIAVLDPRAPEILSFTVTPTITGVDGEILLRWETRFTDAVNVALDGTLLTVEPPSGANHLRLPASGTIEIIASSGASAEIDRRSITVAVDPARPQLAVLAPSALATGETATIAWSTGLAEEISFATDRSELITTSTQSSGSFPFSPPTSVMLIATARNRAGATLVFRPIEVAPRPRIQLFEANEYLVREARPVIYRWRTTGAIAGSLRDAGFINVAPISSDSIAEGEATLFATSLGTPMVMTLEASGSLFSTTASIAIEVLPQAAGFIETEPNGTIGTANGPYGGIGTGVQATTGLGDVDMFAISGPGGPSTRLEVSTEGCDTHTAIDVYEVDLLHRAVPPRVRIEPAFGCAAGDAYAYPELALLRSNLVIAVRHVAGRDTSGTYELSTFFSQASCGDGIVDRGEECDDGANAVGDGCDGVCRLEGRDEREPNELGGDPLQPNQLFRAFLNDDDFDLFSVTILPEQSGPAIVLLESPAISRCELDVRLTLYDEQFHALASDDPAGTTCAMLSGPGTFLNAGNYWISVNPGYDAGQPKRGPYLISVVTP